MNNTNTACGCKGIRTCLLCERDEGKNLKSDRTKDTLLYKYCPHCNFCWPVSDGKPSEPLYLGQINIILDFINEAEEAEAIAAIDLIPWMPSQSGRKKQDFGPKVNFKKRKGKVGDFKGFPHFSKNFIHKFQRHKELYDFSPVELCHLDYSPDRGSAIEPHIDDAWIWGERLVTINLASSTVLTLTPANTTQSCCCSNHLTNSSELMNRTSLLCNHRTPSLSCLTIEPCKQSHFSSNLMDDFSSKPCRDMCGTYRKGGNNATVEIQVLLPPRSLLVLAGCARYNWFHEIKREDVKSRRLAMTFRELSSDFLTNENEKKLGEELLEIGKMFRDFNV